MLYQHELEDKLKNLEAQVKALLNIIREDKEYFIKEKKSQGWRKISCSVYDILGYHQEDIDVLVSPSVDEELVESMNGYPWNDDLLTEDQYYIL